MIVKEYTPTPTTDRFQRAGDDAERQMAHYLRRAFGDVPGVHVFNNLRLEHGGEVAQIDHLVFHKAGFIVIESKSVTSTVHINDREEWAREWKGQKRGMPSPVLQARRQGDLLRALLQAHKEDLRNKVMFGLKQGSFHAVLIDVVVAISDSGVVQTHTTLPEVRKADQVPDRVKELLAEHSSLANPFSRDKRSEQWGINLSPEEVTRISAFLQAKHTERQSVPPPPAADQLPAASVDRPRPTPPEPSASSAAAAVFACGKCAGQDLEIKFGRSYYFHCRSCDGNTAIKLTCPACGTAARTRKSGRQFFRECPTCARSELYFTNP